ncbi:MAG: hypothetical protein GW949_07375 [Spirochaetales bacterium]|nr:hypothetical protein [Spirochaetales bacterium]
MKTLGIAANGEGMGHASRLVTLVPLLAQNYSLVVYAPPTIHGFLLQKLPQLADGTIPLRTLPHLHLAKRGDQITYVRTITENLPTLTKLRTLLQRVRAQLIKDHIDVLISDFEPFSAWAAMGAGIPTLQINHPGIVSRSGSISLQALATKWIAGLMMGPYDKRILVSFFDGDTGPMIRQEIQQAPRGNDGSLVVYVKPGYRRGIVRALEQLKIENYHLFPNPAMNYAQALGRCKAIIAGGGHQTISEALYLGKPILAIPQRGQFEQWLNSVMLERGGFGKMGMLRRLRKDLGTFLSEVEQGQFPKKSQIPWVRYRTGNETDKVLRKIHSFVHRSSATRKQLWFIPQSSRWGIPSGL